MSRRNSEPSDFPALLCLNRKSWEPVPPWTEFYLRLGSTAAQFRSIDRRLVISAATPTRSFAAAFAALGVIQTSLAAEQVRAEDYFETLCSLEKGTPLMMKEGKSVVRVFIEGAVEQKHGNKTEKLLKVYRSAKKKMVGPTYVSIARGSANALARIADDQTRPSNFAVGRKVSGHSRFISEYAGRHDSSLFLMSPKLDCAIVGVLTVLRREIYDLELACQRGEEIAEGSLNDILLVKKFAGATGIYHSDVFKPARVSRLPADATNSVVIFDGANAFLNCRDNFLSNSWVVLLDRTEPQFELAAQTVNQERARGDGCSYIDDLKKLVPPGVEASAFEVNL